MSELASTSNNTPSAGNIGEKIPLRERIARALYDSNRRQFIAFAFSEWDETDKEIQSFFHNDAQAIIEELGLEEKTRVLMPRGFLSEPITHEEIQNLSIEDLRDEGGKVEHCYTTPWEETELGE